MRMPFHSLQSFRRLILFLACSLIASGGLCTLQAQTVRQTITLEKGWNAVYLSVSPSSSVSDLFTQWPVHSVSVYRPAEVARTEQTKSGLSDEAAAPLPMGIWTREEPEASTLRALPADSVLVCFNTNSTSFTDQIEGIPSAPRIAWQSGASIGKKIYNYVGVRLNDSESVTPAAYFAGAGLGAPLYMKLAGQGEGKPTAFNPQRGSIPWTLKDGEALLVTADKLSDWSGPLHVAPLDGLRFPEDHSVASLEIRNDGVEPKTVRISLCQSEDGMSRPFFHWRDDSTTFTTNTWQKLSGDLSKTIQTGETWRVTFGVDRAQFKVADSEKTFGGILRIEERGGTCMFVEVPAVVEVGRLSADGQAPSGTWPAGLWLGEAEFTTVSRWNNDNTRVDGLPAGGRMRLRLLLHISDHGEIRLLQRVLFGFKELTDGKSKVCLFAPGDRIPPEYGIVRRISCSALPVHLGKLAPVSGRFMGSKEESLRFRYTIGEDDPSNPFYHPLHPQFDGLREDFKTPSPSGGDITNYVGEVKPERFPIDGEIRLTFDQKDVVSWDPAENVTGSILWGYSGIRREGPVYAGGTFSLVRVSALPLGDDAQ